MKQKLKTHLKLLTLILGISLLSINCTKDENTETNSINEPEPKAYLERVSKEEIPEIEAIISKSKIASKDLLQLRTGNLHELNEYSINWEEINLITDSVGVKTYAFKLDTPTPNPFVFYNVVISEVEEGAFTEPIIAEYVLDRDYALAWMEDPEKLKNFTGEVFYYNLDEMDYSRNEKGTVMQSRTPGDGPPCPGMPISNGSPGNNNTPNIYCVTYALYGYCETQIQSGAGGNVHGPSQCGAGTGSPILGYHISCSGSPGGGTGGGHNNTRGVVPCGGPGGASLPGATPINPVSPGSFDLGSIVGFLDNKLQLTSDEEAFLDSQEIITLVLYDFLWTNEYSSEAKNFAREAVDTLMDEGDVDFEKDYIEYLIENNKIFYVEIKGPKVDPREETKCFDLTKPAKITIYVEQPIPNSREITANIGHTFIGIEQGNISRHLGFYPDDPYSALLGSQDGQIHENSGDKYNVSLTIDVTPTQLSNVIGFINEYPEVYDLNNYNCSDFGIEVVEKCGLSLPKTIGEYDAVIAKFKGVNPADLGQDIRNMNLPQGVSRNTSGGSAPSKKGGC